jgi:hypothetical protein
MTLQEHPRIMGRWPPSAGGISAISHFAPANCLDTLVHAQYLDGNTSGFPGIALKTVLENQEYVREIFVFDKEFARALCKFLRRYKGKTIHAIGELDVTSEFLPFLEANPRAFTNYE